MQRFIFLFIGTFLLAGESLPMPPMMPSVPLKKEEKNVKLPKSCQMLPPMIYRLPPPMEVMLQDCKSRLYLPSKEKAQKKINKLFKKPLRVIDVKPLKGFDDLYEIETNESSSLVQIYCNKDFSFCIKGERL